MVSRMPDDTWDGVWSGREVSQGKVGFSKDGRPISHVTTTNGRSSSGKTLQGCLERDAMPQEILEDSRRLGLVAVILCA